MKNNRWLTQAVAVGIALGLLTGSAMADVYLPKAAAQRGLPPVQSAEDAINQIPGIAKIPHSFLFGDGYHVKLSGMELRIDHMGTHSTAPASKRVCLIGLSYATPIAFFGSRIEIPLIHAANFKTSEWGLNTLGDYVMHLSKDASVEHPTVGLSVSARF
jgi:hypothetical protein